MHRLAAVLALALAACSPAPAGSPAPQRAPLTLCVANRTLDVLTIRLGSPAGIRLGSVQPGRVERVSIPRGMENARVVAVPVGGGRLWTSPYFGRQQASGWRWSLGVSHTTEIDLAPARGDCAGAAYAQNPDHIMGVTVWPSDQRQPSGWVRAELVVGDPQEAASVAVHEMAHGVSAQRLGRDAWRARIRTTHGAAAEEAFAFCVQAHYAHGAQRRFLSFDLAAWHYAEYLSTGYPFGLSREAAATLIRGACAPKS
jgi:hypothetical protein